MIDEEENVQIHLIKGSRTKHREKSLSHKITSILFQHKRLLCLCNEFLINLTKKIPAPYKDIP